MKLHNSLLSLLYLIRLGEFKTANTELTKLQTFCQQLDLNEPIFYTWMPPINLFSMIYLISVICNKNNANLQNALTIASKGIDLINRNYINVFVS